MERTIGVVVSSRIVAGLIEDHKLVGPLRAYPDNPDDHEALLEHPFESLCHLISDQVMALHAEGKIDAIGVAIPGIIRNGIVEDSPNLAQLKGANIAASLSGDLSVEGDRRPVEDHERCGCGCGGAGRHARPHGSPGAGVDHRQRHWVRALSLRRRRMGGRSHGGDARSQGDLLRMRWAGTPGRNHGLSRDAPALPRHGTGRGLCRCQERRYPLHGFRAPLASRSGRCHRYLHSSGWDRAGSITPV